MVVAVDVVECVYECEVQFAHHINKDKQNEEGQAAAEAEWVAFLYYKINEPVPELQQVFGRLEEEEVADAVECANYVDPYTREHITKLMQHVIDKKHCHEAHEYNTNHKEGVGQAFKFCDFAQYLLDCVVFWTHGQLYLLQFKHDGDGEDVDQHI